MKKSILLFMVIILGLSLLAGCDTPNLKDAGHYVLDSLTYDGETYDAEDLKDSGMEEYSVTLNADGTAELSTDTVIKGTWKNGVISYEEDGEEVENDYVISGDYLTIEVPGADMTLVFKRAG